MLLIAFVANRHATKPLAMTSTSWWVTGTGRYRQEKYDTFISIQCLDTSILIPSCCSQKTYYYFDPDLIICKTMAASNLISEQLYSMGLSYAGFGHSQQGNQADMRCFRAHYGVSPEAIKALLLISRRMKKLSPVTPKKLFMAILAKIV